MVFGQSGTAFAAVLNLNTMNGSNGFRIDGVTSPDKSGDAVTHAGDVNGDGLADLIIGADGAEPPCAMNAGSAFIVYGNSPLLFRNGFE